MFKTKEEYIQWARMTIAYTTDTQTLHEQLIVDIAPFDPDAAALVKKQLDAGVTLCAHLQSKLEKTTS